MKLPVEKNQTYTMSITDIGTNGEGIGRIDGYTVFVEGALPEEVIKVLIVKTKKHFGYGKLLEILEPSCLSCCRKMWRLSAAASFL